MATIQSAIRLNDMMSTPIRSITNAMNMMLSTWNSLDRATSGGLDVSGVESIRAELNQATRALDQMEAEQRDFNREVQNGSGAMDGLTGKIMGALGAYAGLQGLQQLVNLSDSFTQTQARLSMIVDEGSTTEELFDKIAASADRARASISTTADIVAKLGLRAGDSFTSNDETILFAENLNKLFVIAGASQQEVASASLQLTQALGSGVLRGEEFNAIFEAAPNVMQTVADYMDVPIGKLRGMAAEGQITADIVKNALLSATDEINDQFDDMPMTWSQVWTGIMNSLYYASQPILNLISWLAQNWSILQPIVLGVAAALAVYLAATKGVELATKAWAAAQQFFNSVMALNPVFLIIMGVILLIAAIYAIVAAINKVTGSTISATGIITGALAVAGAFIWNLLIGLLNGLIQAVWTIFAEPILGIIEWILNACNGGFNSFGDAVNNLIAQIIGWFLSLGKVVTKIIDAIFGTDWTSGLNALRDDITAWGKTEKAITIDRNVPEIGNRIEYGNAWDSGYAFGEGIQEKIGGFFGGFSGGDQYSMDDLMSGIGDIPAIGDIATNTGDMKDSLDITHEDLKYLRDLAEQETINRFTTAEIRVEMGGVTNNVNSNVDVDGVMDYMVTGIQEAMERSAEGVHN